MLRRRLMMQAQPPAEEAWSYAWDYTMGAPDTALWDYPIGGATTSFDENNGLHMTCSNNAYGGLRYKDFAAWFGQKAVYEVNVNATATTGNGFRIVLASGSGDAPDNKGLQVTINNKYLNVLKRNDQISKITRDAPITYGEWHSVRLELDAIANSNRVYLDDALVADVINADLSTNYVSNIWCLIQSGEVYVRAVRYRKED